MATFAELALPLIQRGISVIPVLLLSKRGFLGDQFRHATTEVSQIAQWNRENPDFNVGCVAKPDGIVVLDCDVKGRPGASRARRATGTGNREVIDEVSRALVKAGILISADRPVITK